jgi:biopolymer transport protein ExbB
MTRFFFVFALTLAAGGIAFAQDVQTAQEKAEQDLKLARQQMQDLQREILAEQGKLVLEVDEIDTAVLKQEKRLRELLRAEDQVAGKQRQLNNELASRKGEFEYTLATLKSYGGSLKDRIHPAEKQDFGLVLEEQRKKAEAASDDLVLEVQNRLAFLALGADRLVEIAGGKRFQGKAVIDGNIVKEGGIAMLGPIGYFASDDGEFAGFTAFSPEGVDFPGTIPLPEAGEGVRELVTTGKAVVPVDASMGKAIQMARTQKTIGEYLEGGGVVGFGILGLGLAALLIALWKLLEINRFPIPGRKKLNQIIDDLLAHNPEAALAKAQKISGLGGKLVEAGVTNFYDKRRVLEDALLERLGTIQPRLERLLPFLALVAAAAPMMGLLGTVLGIMETFAMMSAGGETDSFAGGISKALITTAMGLIVAIPVIIIHGMLKSLAKAKFGQAEGVALSLLNGTTDLGEEPVEDDGEEPGDPDETELSPA